MFSLHANNFVCTEHHNLAVRQLNALIHYHLSKPKAAAAAAIHCSAQLLSKTHDVMQLLQGVVCT